MKVIVLDSATDAHDVQTQGTAYHRTLRGQVIVGETCGRNVDGDHSALVCWLRLDEETAAEHGIPRNIYVIEVETPNLQQERRRTDGTPIPAFMPVTVEARITRALLTFTEPALGELERALWTLGTLHFLADDAPAADGVA